MTEAPYSNRELDKMHNEVLHKLDDFQKSNEKDHEVVHEILTDIKDMLKAHDNRITSLEKWINRLIGGLIVTQLVLLPIVIKVLVDKF